MMFDLIRPATSRLSSPLHGVMEGLKTDSPCLLVVVVKRAIPKQANWA